jgi:tRNA (cmo5U34)-methyltransferase
MNSEKRNFDKEAVNWDENPVRVKMAEDITNAISQHIILTRDMDIMDFGCGTGLLPLVWRP